MNNRDKKDTLRKNDNTKLKELVLAPEDSSKLATTIMLVSSILTFCLTFFLFYGIIMYNTEYRNRKRLLKLLKSNKYKLNFIKTRSDSYDISYFTLNEYHIKLWNSINQLSVDDGTFNLDSDYIGLFEGDIFNMILVRKINKILRKNIK